MADQGKFDYSQLYDILSPEELIEEAELRRARNNALFLIEIGQALPPLLSDALRKPLPSERKREELKKEKEQKKSEPSQGKRPRSELNATSNISMHRFWILYDLIAAEQHLRWRTLIDAFRAIAKAEGYKSKSSRDRVAGSIQKGFMSNKWHESARTLEDLIQRVQEIGSDYGPPETLE